MIKDQLIPVLVELEDVRYVIKRGSSYSCITTDNLRFLDMLSYLAVGTNYDSFLKAYGASAPKSFFPYEWFDGLEKLACTEFPLYTDFYSSLKGRNTLEPSKVETLTDDEAGVIGRFPTNDNPLTEMEVNLIASARYSELREKFVTNEWTFREFLAYYNNRYGMFLGSGEIYHQSPYVRFGVRGDSRQSPHIRFRVRGDFTPIDPKCGIFLI